VIELASPIIPDPVGIELAVDRTRVVRRGGAHQSSARCIAFAARSFSLVVGAPPQRAGTRSRRDSARRDHRDEHVHCASPRGRAPVQPLH
jgi:hypothetical protein